MPAENVVALVTGAARRIGRAVAEDLATHGFAVAIHCNTSRRDAESVADGIRARGGRAAVIAADLTDMEAAAGVVAQAQAALGPVRLLVNSASVFEGDEADQLDWPLWDRHFAIHVKAPVLLTEKMSKALSAGQTALVVNMIDQRVWRLTPRFFSYTLSKSALWTATQTMAQAYAPRIRVNAIGPGPALPNERQEQSDIDAMIAKVPLQRGPVLSEFGATIRYLWETASITGQMIAIDGGQHLAWETPDVAGMVE